LWRNSRLRVLLNLCSSLPVNSPLSASEPGTRIPRAKSFGSIFLSFPVLLFKLLERRAIHEFILVVFLPPFSLLSIIPFFGRLFWFPQVKFFFVSDPTNALSNTSALSLFAEGRFLFFRSADVYREPSFLSCFPLPIEVFGFVLPFVRCPFLISSCGFILVCFLQKFSPLLPSSLVQIRFRLVSSGCLSKFFSVW